MTSYTGVTLLLEGGTSITVPDGEAGSVVKQFENHPRYLELQSGSLHTLLNTDYIGVYEYGVNGSFSDTVVYACEPFVDPNCPACP